MREAPLEENTAAFEFSRQLRAGDFDAVILLTGVGTRYLVRILGEAEIVPALRNVTLIARGPKPVAALREFGLQPTVTVPEPNTWRELIAAIEGRPERRFAVQEYGRPATELVEALRVRGAEVTPVPVYQWDLPEDRGPLEEAARRLARSQFDAVLFTTSFQLVHLLRVAAELGVEDGVRTGLHKARLCSIGPTTTETLREYGFEPAVEASHPKLGYLVKEAAETFAGTQA